MPRGWLWVWLLCAYRVFAQEFVSRSPVLEIKDGRLLQNQTLQVRCTAASFGQTAEFQNTFNGVAQTVRVRCEPLRYVYELQYMGETAEDGKLNLQQFCVARARGNATEENSLLAQLRAPSNADLENAANQGGLGSARRLLAHQIGYLLPDDFTSGDLDATQLGNNGNRYTLRQVLDSCYGGTDNQAALCIKHNLNLIARNASARETGGVTIKNLIDRCRPGELIESKCGKWYRDRTTIRLQDSMRRDVASFVQYMKDMQTWERAIDAGIANASAADEALRELVEARQNQTANATGVVARHLQEANDLAQASLNLTKDTFVNLTGQINSIFSQLEGSLNTTTRNLEANIGILNETLRTFLKTELTRLYDQLRNVSSTINLRFDSLVTAGNTFMTGQQSELRFLFRQLRDTEETIRNEIEARQFQSNLVPRVRSALADELRAGRDPFLVNTGAAPTLDLSIGRTVVIESVVVLWVYSVDSTVRRQVWSLRCDLQWLMSRLSFEMDWYELMLNVGPPDCDASEPMGCLCRVHIEEQRCTEVRPAFDTQPSFVDDLRLDNALVCVPGKLTSFPVQVLDQPNNVTDAARVLCGLTSGRTYRVGARFAKRTGIFTNDGTLCNIKHEDLGLVAARPSPVQLIVGFWENGWSLAAQQFDAMFSAVHGVMPTGLYYRWDPFVHSDGLTKRCLTAGFVATNGTVPVYRLVPIRVEAAVVVTISGRVTRYTDVIPSVALASVLPSAEYFVVGDPRVNTTIYDIPRNSISLDPNEYTRRGTATYLYLPAGYGWNATAWVRLNGINPQHDAATNFPSRYETAINPATNACVRTVASDAGSWCALRDLYSVLPAVGNSSRLEFVPRSQASFDVQVTLPQGDVTRELISTCPLVTVLPQGAGTLLVLSNPLGGGASTSLILAIGTTGALCDEQRPFVLPPGGARSEFIPRCVGAARITFTLLVLEADGYVECSGASNVEITSSPLIYSSVYGNLGAYYVNLTTVDAADQTLLRLQRIEQATLERSVALFTGTLRTLEYNGIKIPTSAYAEYLNRSSNITTGAAFPPVTLRPIGSVTLNLDDFDRLEARWQSEELQRRAEIEDALRRQRTEVDDRLDAADEAFTRSRMLIANASDRLDLSVRERVDAYLDRAETQQIWFGAMGASMRGSTSSGGGLFGAVGSFLNDAAGVIGDGLVAGADLTVGLGRTVLGLGKDLLGSALGIFGSFLGIVTSLLVTLAIALVVSAAVSIGVWKLMRRDNGSMRGMVP